MSVEYSVCLLLGCRLDYNKYRNNDYDYMTYVEESDIIEMVCDCYSENYLYVGKVLAWGNDDNTDTSVNDLLSIVNDEDTRKEISQEITKLMNIEKPEIDLHFFNYYH